MAVELVVVGGETIVRIEEGLVVLRLVIIDDVGTMQNITMLNYGIRQRLRFLNLDLLGLQNKEAFLQAA